MEVQKHFECRLCVGAEAGPKGNFGQNWTESKCFTEINCNCKMVFAFNINGFINMYTFYIIQMDRIHTFFVSSVTDIFISSERILQTDHE